MAADKSGNPARNARFDGPANARCDGPSARRRILAARIEQVSEGSPAGSQGTIYLCLVRLVQGWIAAEWGESENNRKAKFYSITRAGKKQLAAEARDWERVSGTIGRLLQMAKR